MKSGGLKVGKGSAASAESVLRWSKAGALGLATPLRFASHSLRGVAFPRTRRSALFGSLRVCCRVDNGNSASAFSSVATPRLAEESETDEKEVLEHLVRSVDSADESQLEDEDEGAEDDVIQVEADKEDETLLLKNCGLSSETLRAIEKRGITALFPIQKHVFDPAMAGRDLIGRAKTGSGKTLAFAIPVVENLLKENRESDRVERGRSPRAIVIAPTRELANQVCREFQSVCPSLTVKPFYGGVSVVGNKRDLEAGVDVAVGTPGRLMDLVNQGAMDLSRIRFAILDESDQMLDMGFEEDMERILAYTPKDKQTMLFSATLPPWVRKVARKYLTNQLIVDLLGDEGTGKISDTIKAMGILVQGSSKRKMLGDLLAAYAAGKKSIVFTQTKREADAIHSVADAAVASAVLHGDIAQASREATLEKFRRGRFSCLVATDVAARGLDIPSVDLVVHYDSPQSHESFVHRSGRTGRAGKTGTTLVMVTKQEVPSLYKIIRASQTDIEMIGPPNPRDVMQASTKHVLEKMKNVQPEVIKFFQPAASKLLETGDGSQVLAAALASMSGFARVPQPRSLLTQEEGYVTVRLLASPGKINGIGSVTQVLSELMDKQLNSRDIGRHEMVKDVQTQMTGAMVDLPSAVAMQLLQNASTKNPSLSGIRVDRPKALALEHVAAQCPPDRGVNRRGGKNTGPSKYGGNNGGRSRSGGYGGRSRSYSDSDDDFGFRGRGNNQRGRSGRGGYGGRSRNYSDSDDDFGFRGRGTNQRGRSSFQNKRSFSGNRRSFDGYREQSNRSSRRNSLRDDSW